MVELCDLADKQTKRSIAVLTLVVIAVTKFLCEYSFKLSIVLFG